MTRSTFRVLFYANGSKEKNGTVPIMGRVTINGTVAQFSCKRSISKELWDAKGNRAKGKSLEARETNLALDNIKMERQQEEHSRQLVELQAKYRREMANKEAAHQEEVSFLKSIIQKAKKWFPLFQELVYMEKFCLKVGFNERQTATLISGKPLFYEGELYSEEHRRKFKTERAGFQVVKDPKDKSKLALAINGQVIGEWFKEQFGRLFSSVKRTVEPLRRGKGMGL